MHWYTMRELMDIVKKWIDGTDKGSDNNEK